MKNVVNVIVKLLAVIGVAVVVVVGEVVIIVVVVVMLVIIRSSILFLAGPLCPALQTQLSMTK